MSKKFLQICPARYEYYTTNAGEFAEHQADVICWVLVDHNEGEFERLEGIIIDSEGHTNSAEEHYVLGPDYEFLRYEGY